MGEVCRVDAGEHIGQVANFLYAKQRILGYRVEGRPPRSRQWLRFAPPGGFARVRWRRTCAFDRLHLPTPERMEAAIWRATAASGTRAFVAKREQRYYS